MEQVEGAAEERAARLERRGAKVKKRGARKIGWKARV